MFGWMKSPKSNRIRVDEPENRSLFSSKRKERSTDSFSSHSDLEASSNTEFEDTFFVPRESAISHGSKQLSRNIISMFKKKSKDVSSPHMVKSRSTSSLLGRSVNEIADPEAEGNFRKQPGTKKSKRRRRGTLQCVLSLERKKKLFKRKPLDDYAKRKLQISRDSGWEASSSSCSSLSSLVNEVAAFSTSSPIVKTDSKKKQLRISKKLKNTTAILRRRTMLFARAVSSGSSTETCKSEEETSRLLDDQVSSSFGSSSSVNRYDLNSNKSFGDQLRNIADILYKFKGLNFARSLDCLACESVNVKICDKCAASYDASKNQGLKLAKRSYSMSGIKSLRKHGKRPVTPANSFASSSEKVNQSMDLKDMCSNEYSERDRSENPSSEAKSWGSKSFEELFGDDFLFSSSDIAEFNSFNDFLATNSPHSSQGDSDGCFLNEALDSSDEANPTEHADIRQDLLHFDCENEADGSRSFDSFNTPYVITIVLMAWPIPNQFPEILHLGDVRNWYFVGMDLVLIVKAF